MDLGVAQTLAATSGKNDVSGLKKLATDNPAAVRKAAQQFGALMMQNLMKQADGTALPMASGTGSDAVNQMFAGAIGKAVMSNEHMGLTDMLIHALQKKQAQADGAAPGPPAAASPAQNASTGTGFPLAAYWNANGMRPLAAAIANGGISPQAGAVLAMATHLNPKLATTFGAGANAAAPPPPTSGGNTTFASHTGHASGGASAEDIATFTQKLMPLLQKAGQQLGVSPKTLLAQTAIETGWGRSVVGNNLFGIKAGPSWTGQKVDTATHEYENGQLVSITDAFRAYPNAEASVQDFVALVQNSSRYRAALGKGNDAAGYAQALISGGWATDINYVGKLSAVAASPAVNTASAAAPSAGTAPASPAPTAPQGPPPPAGPGQPIPLLPANFSSRSS